jgi:hypothetical protein
MAPSTRATARPSTPERAIPRLERSTKRRIRFFHDYDRDHGSVPFPAICAVNGIARPTGYNWLQQRKTIGSPAYYHTRKLSKVLGHQSRVSKSTCKMLVSPSRNPVRDQLLEAQIEFHNLPIKRRQLSNKLKDCTNGGKRYKAAYIKSDYLKNNIKQRQKHGETYAGCTIENTVQFWVFSDEAHFDPTAQKAGYILRERGTRLEPENIQKRGKRVV